MQTGQCQEAKAAGYCGHKKKHSKLVIKLMDIAEFRKLLLLLIICRLSLVDHTLVSWN